MKVAITGSDGMLGSDLMAAFRDTETVPFTLQDFDVTDLDATVAAVREARPDYLIHAAAYTDVDGSERDPEKAYLINGTGTRNVAMACEEVRCPVMYISTDYIFDGEKGEPYDEWDPPSPVNAYGLSKLMGERFVSSLTNRFYIVRTSWLYGKNGRNFVDTVIRLMSEREELDVVDDQVGSPTCTRDLALKLRELIGRGYGTYHITNSSYCSWYEFALEVARLKSVATTVRRTTSEQFNRPARRPAFSVLNNTMMKLEGLYELRPWKEALEDYLP
ncbi:MAG: dTDP-4-dehydrorhamnose reductase [Nitrospiraceae bacterium]|nr:MAG: dTDP-4-dehydrorhamnose reductase [Nitrospiraceae bacterium]